MSESSGFFVSAGGDRTYTPDWLAKYVKALVTTGVYRDELGVLAGGDMSVSAPYGRAWVEGHLYLNDSAVVFPLSVADGHLGRIDAVILRLDMTGRKIALHLVQGEYSVSPVAPGVTRSVNIYELKLAEVSVPAGATKITQSMVTDCRLDDAVCGITVSTVQHIPTASFLGQMMDEFNTWFETVQGILDEEVAGHLLNLIQGHTSDTSNPHGVTLDQLDAVGRSMAGQSVEPEQGVIVTAGEGAEVFGDYGPRVFIPDASTLKVSGNIASGSLAHAEGTGTTASGTYSHAEGCCTLAKASSTHAEGYLTQATANNAHAEGAQTLAAGNSCHAEGRETKATGDWCAHAEGYRTTASANYSHAEGYRTTASANYSHAEGSDTTASGNNSHAEGTQTTALGSSSHAEGNGTKALEPMAHAEGSDTTASGNSSHAEGSNTTASGSYSHAEGSNTTASGIDSHAEGINTTASGDNSHAEGSNTTASGDNSHAAGSNTKANNYQYVIGTFSVEKLTSGVHDDRFIIGGGWSGSPRNAFRVHSNGNVYGGPYNSSGADYAELFEWADGNPDHADRAGLFVTLDGEHIRIAQPGDDYILGIVSAVPSVVGDVYDDQWAGMYLRDVFGRTIYEEQDFQEETTPDGQIIREARQELAPKLNPDYDPSTPYLPRTQRPEWGAVGLMGKLVAVDDGTCEVNGYCTVGDGGVATRAEGPTPYRVMARLDEGHVRVLIR